MEDDKKVSDTQTDDAGKTDDTGKTASHTERTPEEIAEYNLKRAVEKAREKGIDPAKVIGVQIKVDESLSDETPLTIGTLKEFQKQEAHKTALNLADDIEDEDERNEVRDLLKNRLKPSGDPHADLELARSAVGANRSKQVAEEVARKQQAKRTAAGGSAPAKGEEQFTPTEQEAVFMRAPYNLSKEKILEARKREEAKR